MASVNKVFLLGHCGRDPEVRYLPSGGAVTSISLATTSKRKDKASGETIEDTQWHRVVFYEHLAEIVGEYVKKGSPIFIEGRLKYGNYEKDGVKHYTTDIVATELQLLGSKPDGQQRAPAQTPSQSPSAVPRPNGYAQQSGGRAAAPRASSGFDDMDDDIPF